MESKTYAMTSPQVEIAVASKTLKVAIDALVTKAFQELSEKAMKTWGDGVVINVTVELADDLSAIVFTATPAKDVSGDDV